MRGLESAVSLGVAMTFGPLGGATPRRAVAFFVRLLKKAQMQGGVTHPCRMGTRRGARRTWYVRRSATRARGHPPQVGRFQQPARKGEDDGKPR